MQDAEQADKDVSFPLLAYADELVDGLRQNVPAALHEFDEEAIHQARVATRRLKSALDLLAPVLSKKHIRDFGKVLKKLRRRLGPLRDYDVMIGHLDEIGKGTRNRAAADWLGTEMTEARKQARNAIAGKSAVVRTLGRLGTWWGLREEIIEAREAIASLLAESLHLQLDAFAEQAAQVARQTLAEPQETPEPAPPDAVTDGAPAAKPHVDPHQLRIAGKALRYTLEMAAVEGHQLPKSISKAFKAMQESLGLWHDYVVLTEAALRLALDGMLPSHDPDLATGVIELARSTLHRSVKELKQFSTLWNEKGKQVAQTIRTCFPLTKSMQEAAAAAKVTESPADPDPAGSAEPSTPEASPPADPSAATA